MPSKVTTSGLHLQPRHRRVIEGLARQHLPDADVWAYGSRVNGQSHDGSDLDLVLRGPELAEVPSLQLAGFWEALQESTLPFVVEARDWARLPKRFHGEIQRNYVVLVSAQGRWRDVTLGDCIEMNDAAYAPREGWPFINYLDTGNITDGRIEAIQHLVAGRDKIPSRARRKVKPGDVLYSTVRPNQRHFGIMRDVPEQFLASTRFAVIRGKSGCAHTDFIYWFLAQDSVVEHLHAIAEQSASAYPSIRPTDIERLPLRLPPLREQSAIAQILGALDEKIELNLRMAETLDEAVRALFKSSFVNAEAHWGVKKLAEVSSTTRGRSYRSNELVEDSETAMVTLKSFKRGGGYRPNGLKPFHGTYKGEQLVRSGDVVVACTEVTQNADVVGRSAVVQASRRFDTLVASLDVLILRPKGDLVSSAFLYGLTRSYEFVAHARSYATGTTVLHMASDAVPSFEFACPPREHMAAFDSVAEPAMDRYGDAIQEAERLTELRDTLLPKLISGQFRLVDAQEALAGASGEGND